MKFSSLNRKPNYYADREEMVTILGGFKKTEDGSLETDPVRIKDLYMNTKSEFGPQPVAICFDLESPDPDCDAVAFNFPQHMNHSVEALLKDEQAVAAIKRGAAGVKFYEYEIADKKDKSKTMKCVGVRWVDWE